MIQRLISLALLAAFCTILLAQQTSNIVGLVQDPSGAGVADATVTLTETQTNARRIARTNSIGEYNASSLPPGTYRIEVEKAGFQKLTREGIVLTTASTLNVDLKLQLGSQTQSVVVSEQAPLLQNQSAEISTLVDSRQIVDLPLATRNFTELILLTPGANGGSAGNLAEGGSAYSIRGGANYNVNGAMASGSSYLIDGLYNRNQWLNTLVMVPIVDSIQEYRVMTNSYSAEYGQAYGAVTTVSTKSGTNALHGAAWEFLRNDLLNANSFFANRNGTARPPYHRNVFGANLGAPILKNRLFVFIDYQGARQSIPQVSTTTIPSQAQVKMVQTGDFSKLGIQLYDPFSGTASSRSPFPNNNVSTRLDPAAVKLISLLPAPTRTTVTNNYTITPSQTLSDNQFSARLDDNLSDADRVFVKYSFDRPDQVSPGTIYPATDAAFQVGPYLTSGGNGYATQVQTQSATVGLSHVFSPSLLLEAHVGVVRWYADVAPLGQGYASATAAGIPGINYSSQAGGLPAITISGFAGIGDSSSYPEQSRITTFQYDADIIKVKGTHSIKAGFLFLRHRFNGYSAFPVRGSFDFNGQFTSQIGQQTASAALADFAIGAEDSASRNILLGEFGMRNLQIGGFAQDSWRVTGRFTLEYGARYDVTVPPYEVHNHWANVDIATGLLRVAAINGNDRRLRDTDFNTFQPRIGLAYTLDQSRKTVIRSGFGISYVDTLIGGQQLYKNLPYFFAQSITTTATAPPPSLLSQGFSAPVAPDPNNVAAISTGSPTAWPANNHETRSIQYSAGVQHSFGRGIVAELSYVGSRGVHLMYNNINLNQSIPGPGAQDVRRPYYLLNPNLTALNLHAALGDSRYNSLQARFDKRLSTNINFGVSYTWASWLADVGEPNSGGNGNIQDARCLKCNYGPAPTAFRHSLTVNHVLQLPFGHGRSYLRSGFLSYLVGPWNLSGIWRAHTGDNFTVFYASNVSNSSGGGSQRPNRIGSGRLSSGQDINHWFDPTAFNAPAIYTFGNSGTGILTGPGSLNLDAALERHFPIRDRFDLNFRAEAFNAFNHTNFGDPAANIGNSNAGVISSAAAARVMQVALKLRF
jgi:Carboxypeptidase regulatory-like domain